MQAKTYACAPVGVATFPNRVHVRCSVPDNGIAYFAVATADQNAAARFVAISMGASIAARLVVVSYDPADLSGSSIGCSNLDCRLAQWIEMQGP